MSKLVRDVQLVLPCVTGRQMQCIALRCTLCGGRRADPDEQHDLASVNSSVARQLDGLLRAEFDYTEVDLKVKTNDKMIYQKFFVEPAAGNETALRAHWERAYSGFDDADWAKAKAWAAEQLPPLKAQ